MSDQTARRRGRSSAMRLRTVDYDWLRGECSNLVPLPPAIVRIGRCPHRRLLAIRKGNRRMLAGEVERESGAPIGAFSNGSLVAR
jgi:hypothetical protein